MLTVAATVFSITLAVLSLAASQYSPRVVRAAATARAHVLARAAQLRSALVR